MNHEINTVSFALLVLAEDTMWELFDDGIRFQRFKQIMEASFNEARKEGYAGDIRTWLGIVIDRCVVLLDQTPFSTQKSDWRKRRKIWLIIRRLQRERNRTQPHPSGGDCAQSETQRQLGLALRLENPADSAAEEYVVGGLMEILRAGQRSEDPGVVSLADNLAEFVERVRKQAREVERIALGMR